MDHSHQQSWELRAFKWMGTSLKTPNHHLKPTDLASRLCAYLSSKELRISPQEGCGASNIRDGGYVGWEADLDSETGILLSRLRLWQGWVEAASSQGSSLEIPTGSSCAASLMGSPSVALGDPGPTLQLWTCLEMQVSHKGIGRWRENTKVFREAWAGHGNSDNPGPSWWSQTCYRENYVQGENKE